MSYKIPYICSKVSKHDILNPQKKQMKIISARVAIYSKPDKQDGKRSAIFMTILSTSLPETGEAHSEDRTCIIAIVETLMTFSCFPYVDKLNVTN